MAIYHRPNEDHIGYKWALYDARGIFCTYVCEGCEAYRLEEFRAEIFENPSYEADDLGDDTATEDN